MAIARILLITFSLLPSVPVLGQMNLGRSISNVPMAPKTKKADPLRMNPGVEIPTNPEHFKFQVKHSEDSAAVYQIISGRRKALGKIPTGTEVEMIGVRVFGQAHYYALPWQKGAYAPDGGQTGKQIAWINGHYLRPVSYSPGK